MISQIALIVIIHADFHSPGRLSLPSTQTPEQNVIPVKNNFSLCVLTLTCWIKISDQFMVIDCKCIVVHIVARWWHCYTKLNRDYPLCFARLGCLKRLRGRASCGHTSTHAHLSVHTHIYTHFHDSQRSIGISDSHSTADQLLLRGGGGGAMHTPNKENPYK